MLVDAKVLEFLTLLADAEIALIRTFRLSNRLSFDELLMPKSRAAGADERKKPTDDNADWEIKNGEKGSEV